MTGALSVNRQTITYFNVRSNYFKPSYTIMILENLWFMAKFQWSKIFKSYYLPAAPKQLPQKKRHANNKYL